MWIIKVIILSTCLLQIQCTRLKRLVPLSAATGGLGSVTGVVNNAGAGSNPLGAATGALNMAGAGSNPLGAATGALNIAGAGSNPLGAATGALNIAGAGSNPMGAVTGALGSVTNPAGSTGNNVNPSNFVVPSFDNSSLNAFSSLLQKFFALLIQLLNAIVPIANSNSLGNSPVSNSSPPKQLPPIGGKREVSEIDSVFNLRNQIKNYKIKNNPECNVYSICIARDMMPTLKTMVESFKPNEEPKSILSKFEEVKNKIEVLIPISDGLCSAVQQQCSLSN